MANPNKINFFSLNVGVDKFLAIKKLMIQFAPMIQAFGYFVLESLQPNNPAPFFIISCKYCVQNLANW
jgi:hypothetical protein